MFRYIMRRVDSGSLRFPAVSPRCRQVIQGLLQRLCLGLINRQLRRFNCATRRFQHVNLRDHRFRFITFMFTRIRSLFRRNLRYPHVTISRFRSITHHFPSVQVRRRLFSQNYGRQRQHLRLINSVNVRLWRINTTLLLFVMFITFRLCLITLLWFSR